jgi:uncharacterized protein YcbK (DUF882 family)
MNPAWTRRRLLKSALASGAGLSFAHLAFAEGNAVGETPAPQRMLELHNTHNGEVVSAIYRRGNEYDVAGIARLRHFMRDYRNGQAHDIDIALYDQLYDLAIALRRDARYEIISGYRSPETNAKLAAASRSVAKKSLHLQGRAIDVRLHRCPCTDLRDFALAAKQGGVGYYRSSNFVHLDTGRFRTWAG